LFSLRHLSLCALLISCNVYDESLLDDVQSSVGRGGSGSNAGSPDGSGGRAPSVGGGQDIENGAGEDGGGNAGTSASVGGSSAAGGGSGSAQAGSASGGSTGPGTGGSGGTPNPPTGVDVLDDMEDGNFYLFAKPPRFGYWYVAGDPTAGAKLPKIEQLIGALEPVRDGSASAVHFLASGFKGWGASVGLTFADAAQQRAAYDAGNAVGLSFWVRGSVTDNTKLRVLFPVVDTDPTGKACGGAGQGECLDHFATQLTVTDKWQQVTILFSSLHQAGWGAPLTGFDPAHMLGIEWTAGIANLDVWLDDLALIRP
jgi:hypothetical protein